MLHQHSCSKQVIFRLCQHELGEYIGTRLGKAVEVIFDREACAGQVARSAADSGQNSILVRDQTGKSRAGSHYLGFIDRESVAQPAKYTCNNNWARCYGKRGRSLACTFAQGTRHPQHDNISTQPSCKERPCPSTTVLFEGSFPINSTAAERANAALDLAKGGPAPGVIKILSRV